MRLLVFLMVFQLLLVSCSSGSKDQPLTEWTRREFSITSPAIDGALHFFPDTLTHQVVQSSSGVDLLIEVDSPKPVDFMQFDIGYDRTELHPASVTASKESVFLLAPLDAMEAIPVSLAAVSGHLPDMELRIHFERSPARSIATSVSDLSPPVSFEATYDDGSALISWEANMPGDYNGDGLVSGQDLFALTAAIRGTASEGTLCMDGTGDGKLDQLDVFPIARSYGVRLLGYKVYKKTEASEDFEAIDGEPVSFESPSAPACSASYSLRDDENVFATNRYQATCLYKKESEEEVVEGPPVEPVAMSSPLPGPVIKEVQFDNAIFRYSGIYSRWCRYDNRPYEAEVYAYDPDGGNVTYHWSASGDATVFPETGEAVEVDNDTLCSKETVIVTAYDDNGGPPALFTFSFQVGDYPKITDLKVNGISVEDGGFAGTFDSHTPFTAEVEAYDPHGGEIGATWGSQACDYRGGESVELMSFVDSSRVWFSVTVRREGDHYFKHRGFYIECPPNLDLQKDIMRLRTVPHPDYPESKIRLVLEIENQYRASHGVTCTIEFDPAKVEPAGQARINPDGPFGESLYMQIPFSERINCTVAAFEASIEDGVVLELDFDILEGNHTPTYFRFSSKPEPCDDTRAESNLFGESETMFFRQAWKLIDAEDVILP